MWGTTVSTWKNAYHCQTTGWIYSYTTVLIGPCLCFLTEHSSRLKRDLDWLLCKGRKWVRTGKYLFIDVSDGAIKTKKWEYAVKGPYRLLGQDHHTVVIQRKKLVESTIADRVALAPRLPLESALAIHILNKSLEWISWFFHWILTHYRKDDSPLEALFCRDSRCEGYMGVS